MSKHAHTSFYLLGGTGGFLLGTTDGGACVAPSLTFFLLGIGGGFGVQELIKISGIDAGKIFINFLPKSTIM